MIVANVIFTAFQAAYLSWVLLLPLGIAVLLAEGLILWAFNRTISRRSILACVLGMNFMSYLAGVILAPSLVVDSGLVVLNPDEKGQGPVGRGPEWQRMARLSFIQAGLVSFAVEFAVLLYCRESVGLRSVFWPVAIGNCVSYVLLFLGFLYVFGTWGAS